METATTHHQIDNEPSWITIPDALDLFQKHFGSVKANRGDDFLSYEYKFSVPEQLVKKAREIIRLFHLPLKTSLDRLVHSMFLIIEPL